MSVTDPSSEAAACACGRAPPLCVCPPEPLLVNRVRVLVLQHPQEQDRALGTAFLLTRCLAHARLRIGLSWPSLRSAWQGKGAATSDAVSLEPQRWAVLYLGARGEVQSDGPALQLLDRRGAALPDAASARAALAGIVLLDGSWAQAKALWWRNPWLLKLRRIVLQPQRPSRYGALRREPRREALATLEAAALTLAELAGDPALETTIAAPFETLLQRYLQSGAAVGGERKSRRPPRRR